MNYHHQSFVYRLKKTCKATYSNTKQDKSGKKVYFYNNLAHNCVSYARPKFHGPGTALYGALNSTLFEVMNDLLALKILTEQLMPGLLSKGLEIFFGMRIRGNYLQGLPPFDLGECLFGTQNGQGALQT